VVVFVRYSISLILCWSIVNLPLHLQAQYYSRHHIAPATWQFWSNANEIVIANPNVQPANVEIRKSDSTLLITQQVTKGNPLIYRPIALPSTLPRHPLSKVLLGAGLLVSSDSPVSVNIRNVASDQLGDDSRIKGNASLTSFGNAGIGTSFRVGYYRDDNGPSPIYSVMALADSTVVRVETGQIFTIQHGQSVLFSAPQGSLVETSTPCVMTTGSFLDAPGGCGDGTFDQIPPIQVLGSRYFVVRTRGNVIDEQSTLIATQDNLIITVRKYSVTGTEMGESTYTLQKAGDLLRIPNGDGSTPFSVAEISANGKLLVYVGSAEGCEVDVSTHFPVSSECNGSNFVETSRFVNYFSTPLPYVGYILTADSSAMILANGQDLESLSGKRVQLGKSGWYLLKFNHTQLGNPSVLTLESPAKMNVSIIQIGAGFSMSATFSSFIEQPPTPTIQTVSINPCEGSFATLTTDSTATQIQWFFNGNAIPGATGHTLKATQSGNYHISSLQPCGEETESAPVSVRLFELPGPDVETLQEFCFNAKVIHLLPRADSIRWYSQPAGGIPLADSVLLEDGGIYYASQIIQGCESLARNLARIKLGKLSTDWVAEACNQYLWNDTFLTTSGIYQKNLTTEAGCDSLSILHLTIHKDTIVKQTLEVCNSHFWTATGEELTSSGTYYGKLKTRYGCDSLCQLDLTVHPSYILTEEKTACDSFVWDQNQENYTSSLTTTAFFTSDFGCDSIYTLNLTIHPSYSQNFTRTSCNNYFWESTRELLNKSGKYIFAGRSQAGCDSLEILELTIHPSYEAVKAESACDSLYWPETNKTYKQSGRFSMPWTSVYGCDSIIYLDLSILPSYEKYDTSKTCDSLIWDVSGQVLTNSGEFIARMQTLSGCDSTHMLLLSVYPSFKGEEQKKLCDSFTWRVNGQTYTSSGRYLQTFTSSHGCDSTYILNLEISPSFLDTIVVEATDAYNWDISNTIYSDSGYYIFHSLTENGCDSIYILDLRLRKSNKYTWPNIISSDRNGQNDAFTIYNIQNLALIRRLSIFDRWGNLMAEFENILPSKPELGWNGKRLAEHVVPGVYVFTADLEFTDKSTEQIKGDITVIR